MVSRTKRYADYRIKSGWCKNSAADILRFVYNQRITYNLRIVADKTFRFKIIDKMYTDVLESQIRYVRKISDIYK